MFQVLLKKERLRDIIARSNLSLGDIERASGLSKSLISMYLSGKRLPSAKTRAKLQSLFQCGWDELFVLPNVNDCDFFPGADERS